MEGDRFGKDIAPQRMAKDSSHEQIASKRQSLLTERVVDETFIYLEKYQQEDDNPVMVEDITNDFFKDAEKAFETIEEDLKKEPVDFVKERKKLRELREIANSFGAVKIKANFDEVIGRLIQEDIDRFKTSFEELKKELENMKGKLKSYYELVKQAGPAGPDPTHPTED